MSGNARANRFVVSHRALGIRSAVARIPANAIDAGAVAGALAVAGAGYIRDSGNSLALAHSVADVTAGAHANHRPHRQRSDRLAVGRSFARLQHRARILAPAVQAGQHGRTIAVVVALDFALLLTERVRIAAHSGRASAQRDVILDSALRVRSARMLVNARVDALRIYARSVVRAVVIAATSDDVASFVRISAVPAGTLALGGVSSGVTFGVRSARILHQARIHAIAVDTGATAFAFRISATSDCQTNSKQITSNRTIRVYLYI